jgi:hypothetical protein
MYGLKPVPFTEMSFSAACKAHFIFQLLAARLKSCPVTKHGLIQLHAEFFRSLLGM